jgi:PadR family transcriptional regulator PadR
MDVENTKTQMRKGILDYCILAILNEGEAYSTDVIQQLKDAKMIVVEGTVYPLLTRLKNAGVLQYKWEESTSGPPRKYYTLTDSGKEILAELDGTWNELKTAVNQLTKS